MSSKEEKTPPSATSLTCRPAVLDRLEFILLLAAVAAAVLVYPLCLKKEWLQALGAAWSLGASPAGPFWARFSREQLEPLLSFYVSPLIFKGVLAGIPLLAFVAVRGIRRLLAPAALAPSAAGRWAWASVPAFFGWLALSAAWSPTPAVARQAAVWVAMFGLFFFALLRRGLTPGELRALAHFLLLLGLVALTIVFLEALPRSTPLLGGKIFNFLPYFGDSPRNRYGSLLGHNTAAASFLMVTLLPCLFLLVEACSRPSGRSALRAWALPLAYGVYLALGLLAILVLQSRAVWIFLPVLGFLALRSVLRQAGLERHLRWLPTALLALLALVLVTQSIDRPWNPLYIQGNPLGRRLKDLGPASLKGEARLRLNVISATLVPEHPLKGHGLFAFQYVYPRRQAEYFAEHPGSKLNMTVERSDMAHNEYMQVLVDQGAIGLALLGWLLWEVAARGRRRRRELLEMRNAECGTQETGDRNQESGVRRSDRAMPAAGLPLLHEGVGWGALAFALHALVDFPFHLPQLAIPGLLLLAGWGALRLEGAPAPAAAPPLDEAAAAAFRPRAFARLLGALLLAMLVPLGGWPLLRGLQGDICYSRGKAWRYGYGDAMQQARLQKNGLAETFAAWRRQIGRDPRLAPAERMTLAGRAARVEAAFRQDLEVSTEVKAMLMRQVLDLTDALARAKAAPETILPGDELLKVMQQFEDFTLRQRVQMLQLAAGNFQQAMAIIPWHALIPEELAEARLRMAQTLRDAARKAAPNDPARAEEALGQVNIYLKDALAQLDVSRRGLDGYPIYWTRAQIYRELAALHPGQGYEAPYRENLARAQFYCPLEHRITDELIGVLQRDPHPDTARIRQLKRQYWTIDSGGFRIEYIFPAYQAIRDQRYALAARLWEELADIDPNCAEFVNYAIRANQLAGNRRRALELTNILHKRNEISLLDYGGLITELTYTRDEPRLYKWFRYVQPPDPAARAEYRAMEIVTRRLFGRDPGVSSYARPEGVTETQWKLLVAEEIPRVLFHYFEEPRLARQAMDARLAMTEAPPSARFWIEGFYIAEALGDQPLMRQCLEQARQADPEAPALPDLAARLPAAGGAQRPAVSAAGTAPVRK